MLAATLRAPLVGVRRSWAPERISVGTFGGGPRAGGDGAASGQSAQQGISAGLECQVGVEGVEG